MASLREFKESPWEQGVDEQIAYAVTVPTSWGTSPASVTVTLKRVNSDGSLTDVSGTNLSGSNSVNGQVITTKVVYSLTANAEYRLEVKFTASGRVLEAYGTIYCRE